MVRLLFNVQPMLAQLGATEAKLSDLTPLHQAIGEQLVVSTKQRFVDGRDPEGNPWQPKSPATLAAYLARKDGNRPKPLIGPSGRLGREIASFATKGEVEIGSALIYSGVMQEGAAQGAFGANKAGRPIPWGAIPARVWLGISKADETDIQAIVGEYLAEGMDEQG